jgi:glycosyltransferase involved in cell wall biosynthesis
MTTLIVCDVIRPGGGPGGYVWNLRLGLSAAKHASDVNYWSMEDAATNTLSTKTGGDNLASRIRNRMYRGPALPSTLRAAIHQSKSVVFHGYQSPRRLKFARAAGKKVVYMPHSPSLMADELRMNRELAGNHMSKLEWDHYFETERDLFREADLVVFPSENAAACYDAIVRQVPTAIEYIKSGVKGFAQEPRTPKTRSEILFAGRYVSHKGFDLFLAAAQEVARTDGGARFSSIGNGPISVPASSVVVDHGWQPRPADFLREADVVVVPNRVAYFDLLPLEVASVGRGMVMTEVGGNIDQLATLPDTIGTTVEAVAQGIRSALSMSRADVTWGTRNTEAFHRLYSEKALARSWIEFMDRLES